MGSIIQHTGEERPVEIVEYTIVFANGQEVYVYKDSAFYTIKEAYDVGLITRVDVYGIGQQVSGRFLEQYPSP
jgi:hypothetical protein